MLSNINQRKIFSAVFSFNQLQNTKVLFKRDKKFTKIISIYTSSRSSLYIIANTLNNQAQIKCLMIVQSILSVSEKILNLMR